MRPQPIAAPNPFLDPMEQARRFWRDSLPMREKWRGAQGLESGVPIRTDMQPRVDVASQAFKDWFAGSVMVNPDGSPRSFWHGTFQDFESFKGYEAHRPEWRADTVGIYFSDAHDYACRHGYNVMKVYLNARCPLVVTDYADVCRISVARRAYLASQGYDAITFSLRGRADEIDEIAVFDPDQVMLVSRKYIGDPVQPPTPA